MISLTSIASTRLVPVYVCQMPDKTLFLRLQMAQPTKPQHQHQRRHFGQQRKQMFFETVASSPLQVYIFYIGIARYFLKTFRFLSLNC